MRSSRPGKIAGPNGEVLPFGVRNSGCNSFTVARGALGDLKVTTLEEALRLRGEFELQRGGLFTQRAISERDRRERTARAHRLKVTQGRVPSEISYCARNDNYKIIKSFPTGWCFKTVAATCEEAVARLHGALNIQTMEEVVGHAQEATVVEVEAEQDDDKDDDEDDGAMSVVTERGEEEATADAAEGEPEEEEKEGSKDVVEIEGIAFTATKRKRMPSLRGLESLEHQLNKRERWPAEATEEAERGSSSSSQPSTKIVVRVPRTAPPAMAAAPVLAAQPPGDEAPGDEAPGDEAQKRVVGDALRRIIREEIVRALQA